jgi:hypothetical protein
MSAVEVLFGMGSPGPDFGAMPMDLCDDLDDYDFGDIDFDDLEGLDLDFIQPSGDGLDRRGEQLDWGDLEHLPDARWLV